MRRITAGALPISLATHRASRRRPCLLWLAAVLFALRALLPTGFMPDPDALRAGRFELVYCSAAGPMPAGMAMAAHGHGLAADAHPSGGHGWEADTHPPSGGHGSAAGMHSSGGPGRVAANPPNSHAGGADDYAPAPPEGSGMAADCPCGLTGGYTFVAPLRAVVAPMPAALAWRMPDPPPAPSPQPGIIAGPPVGLRAPPLNLA